MKRYLKITLTALACLVCLTLASCGFVRFVSTESDTLANTKKEYVAYIQSLYDADSYFEEQRREYIEALIEVENLINEAKSLEEILRITEEYEEILGGIPLSIELTRLKVYGEIQALAAEKVYREAEQRSVELLILHFGELIDASEDVAECENLTLQFKTRLANIKTDAQLYAEELEELKLELELSFGDEIDYAAYRSTERDGLEKIFKEFLALLKTQETKEDCINLASEMLKRSKGLPTYAEIICSQRADWMNLASADLTFFAIRNGISINEKINQCLLEINEAESEQEAKRKVAKFIMDESQTLGDAALEDMRAAVKTYIENLTMPSLYREEELAMIAKTVGELSKSADSAEDLQTLAKLSERAEREILSIPTSKQLWAKEDAEFAERMQSKYGELALDMPASLTYAGDVSELADIIDYYAFYQLDGKSFERGSFCVELGFAHRYAEYVIRDVYWYCELLRSAVGITGYFEQDTSDLVITLIPYELATLSHTDSPVKIDRYDSKIEFSGDAELKDRAEDFDAFPYYELYGDRRISVWYSQQLWYALEHEYLPIPVPDSPAHKVLERAKEILRDIIKDGMTIEQKVFAIYSWYADNVTYDYQYSNYMAVDQRADFPDVLVSTLNCFHAEGALFDNLAVCCAYAKSALILMRIEGIEAYRVILHKYENNAIDNLGAGGYGSHAIIALRGSDGKFYYCDVEQSAAGQDLIYQKYHQLLVSAKEQFPYSNSIDRIWDHLDYGESLPKELLWNKLSYAGEPLLVRSEESLRKMIDELCRSADTQAQINIFCDGDEGFGVREVLDADPRITYHHFSYGGLDEYMINFVGDAT